MITVADIAAALKVTPGRVRQLLDARGIKPAKVFGRTGVYPPETLDALRVRQPPGRPKTRAGRIRTK